MLSWKCYHTTPEEQKKFIGDFTVLASIDLKNTMCQIFSLLDLCLLGEKQSRASSLKKTRSNKKLIKKKKNCCVGTELCNWAISRRRRWYSILYAFIISVQKYPLALERLQTLLRNKRFWAQLWGLIWKQYLTLNIFVNMYIKEREF